MKYVLFAASILAAFLTAAIWPLDGIFAALVAALGLLLLEGAHLLHQDGRRIRAVVRAG